MIGRFLLAGLFLGLALPALGDDWPQWRGPNRDGKATGFKAPRDLALVSLTPAGQLVVFEPSDKEFKQIANYPVSDTETYAYPILDGNRVFIKDKDNLTLWTVE